jgi:acetolactate decarboxylase
MANLMLTIPPSLEATVREVSDQKKISVDSLVNAALSDYLGSLTRRIYQISTSTALVEGVYSGSRSSSALLEHGNFGLGTFEGLDGEMVILDGEIYQAAGTVRPRTDEFLVPFAAVTHFDQEDSFEIENVTQLKDIELACDQHRVSENLFYALRVEGLFDAVHARAVHPVSQSTRLLDAAKTELEFEFRKIQGTLVCFWSPEYSSSFSVPGYHFHFLSQDRTKGGHVLNCSAHKLQASIQTIFEYDVWLPERGSFLTTDLSNDPAADLKKTE